MALVMVLGVLAVTLLMVVHAMTVCEVISRDSYVSTVRMQQRYVAESAADHAFWMHLADRSLYSDRTLGGDDTVRESNDFAPWMADRSAHEPFESNCQVYIATVEKTYRIEDTDSFRKYVDVDDTDTIEIIDTFLDVLGDYTDEDSMTKLSGKEYEDYAAEGYASMPRNGSLQFVEELYWLEGWRDVVDSEVTIIPPQGKSFTDNASQVSFFSASPSEISAALDLDDNELELVLDAREEWLENGTSLSESLPTDLYINITSNFSFTESNVAEYIASAANEEGDIRVVFRQVRECDISSSTIYADKEEEAFSIWKRIVY